MRGIVRHRHRRGRALSRLTAIDRAWRAVGLDVAGKDQQTPEGLAAFNKGEIDKWWPIMKAAGIKPE